MPNNINISAGIAHLNVIRQHQIEDFAPYVAELPWFNIDVLHKLYINIFMQDYKKKKWSSHKIRAITCGDFLQSTKVSRIDLNVFIITQELRDNYRHQLNSNPKKLKQIGEFMLAYSQDCTQHSLSPRYMEVYRIEGNLIVDPKKETSRISQHIVDQLNQISDYNKKKDTVAYYLKILNNNTSTNKDNELFKFLKGYSSGTWKDLTPKNEAKGKSINIRLPETVKSDIIKEITRKTPPADPEGNTSDESPISENRKYFSLHIGINDYQRRPLHTSVNDIISFQKILSNSICCIFLEVD